MTPLKKSLRMIKMKLLHRKLPSTMAMIWISISTGAAVAEDWPAWRGQNRDGVSTETGLLQEWPEDGPPMAWVARGLGIGYGGPAVVGTRLFIMGSHEQEDRVFCLDISNNGQEVWTTSIGKVRHDGGGYPGSRATPTVDNGKVYCLGCSGDLACLDAASGETRWRRDMVRDFGGKIPPWGYSESVLVDGDLVLCTPGGKDATIVALDKEDGKVKWKSPLDVPAAYSSLVKANLSGVPQYITLTELAVVAVDAKAGTLLWKWDRPSSDSRVKIPTCIVADDVVFSAVAYDFGAAALRIQLRPDGTKVNELYHNKLYGGHEGGFVRVGDHVYLTNRRSELRCVHLATGRTLWQDRTPGKGSLMAAEGLLYCRDLTGRMTLVEATPTGFRQRGRFQHPELSGKQTWAHPVISDRRLFLRDQEVLLCYDVRAAPVP